MFLLRMAAVVMSLGLCLFLSGCEDCLNCPLDEEIMSDFDVILGSMSGIGDSAFHIYSTKSMTFKDTFILGDLYSLNDMAVSGDGSHLILWTHLPPETGSWVWSSHLTVYDINTRDTILTYPFGGEIEVSNTGKYIAVSGSGGLTFLDGKDYSIIFSDTASVEGGRFLIDDSRFYCTHQHRYIRIYDMCGDSLQTIIEYKDNDGNSPSIYFVQPAADGRKLFLSSAYTHAQGYIISYYIGEDSSALFYPVIPPGGDLRMTPDESHIIVTDPGQPAFDIYGTGHVIFFNPETDAVESIVPAMQSIAGSGQTGFIPCEFAVTPDSKYVIVANCGLSSFGMIDVDRHSFIDVQIYDNDTMSFKYVACRKKL